MKFPTRRWSLPSTCVEAARRIGFPVMLKAPKVVEVGYRPSAVSQHVNRSKSRRRFGFADVRGATLYASVLEVQIVGDEYGNAIALTPGLLHAASLPEDFEGPPTIQAGHFQRWKRRRA